MLLYFKLLIILLISNLYSCWTNFIHIDINRPTPKIISTKSYRNVFFKFKTTMFFNFAADKEKLHILNIHIRVLKQFILNWCRKIKTYKKGDKNTKKVLSFHWTNEWFIFQQFRHQISSVCIFFFSFATIFYCSH